jgi:hypothetical protein
VAKRDLDELRIGDSPEHRDGSREPYTPAAPPVRRSARWRTIATRGIAPVLAWFALVVVVFGSERDTDYDLQLTVPNAARAGEDLPMRAWLYENLRAIEGPRLSARELQVQLEDASGHTIVRGRLEPARAGQSDIEGSLRIPPSLHGGYRLRALTPIDTVRVEVSQKIQIGDAARLAVQGRPLRALQQFSEGPLQPEAGAIAPDVLRVRVGGGACVPEEECRIFVHVGTPAASVWIEGNSTVTPQAAAAQIAEASPGVRAFSVVTHGPEAQLWLRASREGAQVAHRSVRLPVALGASRLRLGAAVVAADQPLSASLLGGEGGCILDVFRDEQWVRTSSAPSCAQPQSIAALPRGVYRVQGRRDPFASATAGVAVAYVLEAGESKASAIRMLAQRVAELDPTDRFAKNVLAADDDALQLDAASFGYLAAVLEAGVIELPRAVSGYAAAVERLAQGQAQLRWLSLLALVLGALSLALAVGRSGWRAAARADENLLDAGHSGPVRRRARARAMLSLALSLLSLMLVFVVLGAYVVARAGPW